MTYYLRVTQNCVVIICAHHRSHGFSCPTLPCVLMCARPKSCFCFYNIDSSTWSLACWYFRFNRKTNAFMSYNFIKKKEIIILYTYTLTGHSRSVLRTRLFFFLFTSERVAINNNYTYFPQYLYASSSRTSMFKSRTRNEIILQPGLIWVNYEVNLF